MPDPNLDHPAVKLYRDVMKFCPNAGRRSDIAITVKDLNLWKEILEAWKARKWNPLTPQWMLSEYERREKSASPTARGTTERRAYEKDVQVGVSKRRHPEVSSMPTGKGIDVRASRGTLARIVATALQEMQQPDRSNK